MDPFSEGVSCTEKQNRKSQNCFPSKNGEKPVSMAQTDVRPTVGQEGAGSTLPGAASFFLGD